jgi:hypothetical protein
MTIQGTERAAILRTVYPEREYNDMEIVAHHAKHARRLPFASSARPRTTDVPTGPVQLHTIGTQPITL